MRYSGRDACGGPKAGAECVCDACGGHARVHDTVTINHLFLVFFGQLPLTCELMDPFL